MTSSPLIPYTSSGPPTPTKLPLSPGVPSTRTPNVDLALADISTVYTNPSILGEIDIILAYDGPRYRDLVEESTLINNSSMNVFLPNPVLQPRPLPPAKLVFWGVLEYPIEFFLYSCKPMNHAIL